MSGGLRLRRLRLLHFSPRNAADRRVLASQLQEAADGHMVARPRRGTPDAERGADDAVIAPERGREDCDRLIRDLAARGALPDRIVHLWLLTADEGHRPGSSFFHRTQEQGFWNLLHLAQALAAEDAPPAHWLVVTSDAQQIRREGLRHPAKATAMGPALVIPREFPGTTVAVLDLPVPRTGKGAPLDPALLAEALATPANTVAAVRYGIRHERGLRQAPLDPAPVDLTGPVLITGGFGGIGLTIAEALIRRTGAPVVLIGRNALPPRADWDRILRASADVTARRIRAVRKLEEAGGRVLTLAADVANVEDMRAARAAAEAAFGPLRGVIHAAGVVDDAPILSKSPAAIEDVFTPKIHGTEVIDTVFPDGTLDWMVLFSSTSTMTAPAGQVDYVSANEYLNAVAQARAGGRTRVTAIDWGIWQGVGMAAEAMEARTGRTPPPATPISAPLLDAMGFDGEGNRIFTATWTTARWVLDEHRTRDGRALVPGTGIVELAAQALRTPKARSGIEVLRAVKRALNLRIAAHLGLTIDRDLERRFDLVFPVW